MESHKLMELALAAREHSYCPYSHFAVGAALLTESGKVYTGCNIENAAYTPTNCAERTAFFKAVSEGEKAFTKIAICGGKRGESSNAICSPCGVCRQVMMEFCNPKEFVVVLGNGKDNLKEYTLEEILPMGFGPEDLKERK